MSYFLCLFQGTKKIGFYRYLGALIDHRIRVKIVYADQHEHDFTLHIRKDHAWIKHTPFARFFVPIEKSLIPTTFEYLMTDRIEEYSQKNPDQSALNDLSTLYSE